MNKIWRALLAGCFGVAILSGFVVIGLQESFIRAPKVPDTQTGHVIPFSNHGDIHYVTQLNPQIFDIALFTGMIALFSGVLVGLIGKK
jgi:hypothetical protein